MIKQIMIPVAAFAVTATSVSAFNVDTLKNLDLDLSNEQINALEEVHEMRQDGATRAEVREVLEEVELDREKLKEVRKAVHEARKETREQIKAAVLEGDYDEFQNLTEDTKLAEVIESEADFSRLQEAHELREDGDREGAREIMEELGFERSDKKRFGQGERGERFGHRGVDRE